MVICMLFALNFLSIGDWLISLANLVGGGTANISYQFLSVFVLSHQYSKEWIFQSLFLCAIREENWHWFNLRGHFLFKMSTLPLLRSRE